ncbi:cobalt ABC transporter [Propioniciclava soli]|uniref:Cobalt ABC transporter n=1 Tax=Propioniciclava soli TaxID=2775081 RepID=A0ABZ3CBJ7_9ACTN
MRPAGWARVRDALAAPARPVVLIDGGSGAGKTSLARALADDWPGPVRLVSLDDVYPGWEGLRAGSDAVARDILHPRRPGFERWDWERGRAAGWVDLDPAEALIVEGCGTLTPANRALATGGLWVSAPPALRRARALGRDGETFAAHWAIWAAQERAHWREHRPRALADWICTRDTMVRGPFRVTPP